MSVVLLRASLDTTFYRLETDDGASSVVSLGFAEGHDASIGAFIECGRQISLP